MKVLDLFSGIGGFSLGLEAAGMETIAFCEIGEFPRKVLAKHWPNIPIHDDVRALDGKQYRGSVDIVCGGFPCQDLSLAGAGAGFEGERSSLYREMLRVISECLPRYAIFENVPGLLIGDSGRWFAKFLYDLAEIGFDAEWHCISAAYVGAVHHRDRVWVIAYTTGSCFAGKIPANASIQYEQRRAKIAHYLKQQIEFRRSSPNDRRGFNLTEPTLCGTDDGVSRGMDRARLAVLGNAVVPQIPEIIGRAILQYENNQEE